MNFSQTLQAEFARRRERNARYSLRAFARDLGADHSALSQILRNRRNPSARMISRLGRRLRLDSAEIVQACVTQHAAAILDLARAADFRPNSRWIATRSGIPLDEVNIALHQLLLRGDLKMQTINHWKTKPAKPVKNN